MNSDILRILTIVIIMIPVRKGIKYMSSCKWSNEGCITNTDCCSRRCIKEHPGTNYRCTNSGMGEPCLYNFHCVRRMKCGLRNRCCAKHWGTCSSDTDCCKRYHTCQKTQGFIYRKCRKRPKTLMPKSSAICITLLSDLTPITIVSSILAFTCIHAFMLP